MCHINNIFNNNPVPVEVVENEICYNNDMIAVGLGQPKKTQTLHMVCETKTRQ